jgi:hypothetical protein
MERRLIKHRDNLTFTLRNLPIALSYGLDDRGFESRQELGIFLLTTVSRPALGPTQLPIQWVQGALPLGVKRPEREADHLPPSSAEVKNEWSYTSTPLIRFYGSATKHRDNFNFTFYVCRSKVFENRLLRVFGPKREGVAGGWREFHNEKLYSIRGCIQNFPD